MTGILLLCVNGFFQKPNQPPNPAGLLNNHSKITAGA